ncbi:MAG: aminopeptidase P family protein [Acidobacteria bacterium]|nr:aminopeptidase P family protein [Acidobacteriota bacterium]
MSGARTYPVDDVKLERVHSLMAAEDLDVLVVRAPDNVVYLTNYWPMKGYAMAVFPRRGEATLVVLEPQEGEALDQAWTQDVRPFLFYDPSDPRPPAARAMDKTIEVLRERGLTGRIGIELSQGSQSTDRMLGEPTVFTMDYFTSLMDVADETVDAVPLLSLARIIKTAQEIERMRIANEVAALALEATRKDIHPGMSTSQVGGIWEGYVHSIGIGYENKVKMARGVSLIWSGDGIQTFTPTKGEPVAENEPTLFEIWVCVDGYWNDLTKNMVFGELEPRYDRLLETLLAIFAEAIDYARPGATFGGLDELIRARIEEAGYLDPSHPVSHGVGARAHEPPWPHRAAAGRLEEGMVIAIEPGTYFPGGGGLRLEDNFLITSDGAEQLCRYPDDFRS